MLVVRGTKKLRDRRSDRQDSVEVHAELGPAVVDDSIPWVGSIQVPAEWLAEQAKGYSGQPFVLDPPAGRTRLMFDDWVEMALHLPDSQLAHESTLLLLARGLDPLTPP